MHACAATEHDPPLAGLGWDELAWLMGFPRPVAWGRTLIMEGYATFGAFFEAHAGFVFRSVRHLGSREAEVSDRAQEVFLIAYEKRAQLRDPAGARSWLYRICFNVVRNHQRLAHTRRERSTERPAERLRNPTPTDPVELRQTHSRLEQVLDRLDAEKRVVLVAHSVEEMSVREIAEALEIPVKTVYSRLYAARRQARDAWLALEGDEPKEAAADGS